MERPTSPATTPALVAGSFASQLEDPSQLVVVGVSDGHVAGYGTCAAVRSPGEDPIGSIGELYVSPRARNQGVGHAMAATLVQWCEAEGCAGVDALALPGSRATKSFFEREGFTARLLVMHRSLVTARPSSDNPRPA
jgi:GNAT superfamily N-acetyltransferase